MHKSGNSFLKSVKFENDGVNKIIYEIPDLNRSGQIAVIFNPVSGKKKSSGNQNQILRDLKSSIPDCIIHDSINQEETKEFINSALEEGINFFVVANWFRIWSFPTSGNSFKPEGSHRYSKV